MAPVSEIFRHVGEFGTFHRALARAHVLDRLYRAGADSLSATIERRLAGRTGIHTVVPAAVRARALAGGLFAMLLWWVDAGAPHSPERMDEMFHAVFAGGGFDRFDGSTST